MKSESRDHWIREKFCHLRLRKELIIVDKFTEVPTANITSDRLIRLLPGQNRIVNLADYCLIVPLSVNLTYRKS